MKSVITFQKLKKTDYWAAQIKIVWSSINEVINSMKKQLSGGPYVRTKAAHVHAGYGAFWVIPDVVQKNGVL